MDIAALILSIISLIISLSVLIVYLARNVFSQHSVQMVPVDSMLPGFQPGKKQDDDFEEFDFPSAMDVALGEVKPKKD